MSLLIMIVSQRKIIVTNTRYAVFLSVDCDVKANKRTNERTHDVEL